MKKTVRIKFSRVEKYFFWAVLLLNLYPVLSVQFFVTTDGPAHLYNATIIDRLLFYNDAGIKNFFVFNEVPVPNCMGHYLIAFFYLFLPAFLAEKAFLLTYLILLPLSVRYLIKSTSPENYGLCYLVFPFTYSYPLFLGFYNFAISLVFLFFSLAYWIKNEADIFQVKKILVLFCLVLGTYFSHLSSFIILTFLIALHSVLKTAPMFFLSQEDKRNVLFGLLKKGAAFGIACLIPVVLSLIYMNDQSFGKADYLNTSQLISWLKNTRPYMTLDPVEKPFQEIFTKICFYTIAAAFMVAMYYKIRSIMTTSKSRKSGSFLKNIFDSSDFLLLSAGLMLLLYFTLPEHSWGGSAYIPIRLQPVFFLFLSAWIATRIANKYLVIIFALIVLSCSFALNYSYSVLAKRNDALARECHDVAAYISPNSTVSSFVFSDDWYLYAVTDYVGVDAPIVMLDNYECYFNWFPLKWSEEKIYRENYGNFITATEFDEVNKNFTEETYKQADYVLLFSDVNILVDSLKIPLQKTIADHYELKYESKNCHLFEKRKFPK